MDELERNNRISSDRVVVENFFGRVCMLFGIICNKYRWSREKFSLIVDFCFSLTNFHIRLHPLREQDGEYYKKVMADLKRRKEMSKDRVKKRQQKHRARQARMQASMEELEQEEVGFGEATAEVPTYLADEDGKCIVCLYLYYQISMLTHWLFCFNRIVGRC